jgi:energy-coupling factor transporter ATP-binding protein EcfA2
MIRVYKNFNKPYEIFLGLSLTKLIQAILITGIIIWIFISVGLSPKNPLSLFFLIPWIVTLALIIKSDDDFYIKLLTHPFNDHIYFLNEKEENYPLLNEKLNIKEIKDSIIYKKDNSISKIIKINHGISIQNLSEDEKESLLENWSGFLSQYNKISNFDDYFAEYLDKEQIEFFINIEKDSQVSNYYLIINQEALNQDKSKLERLLFKIASKLQLIKTNKDYDFKKEIELLEEKLSYCSNHLNSIKLEHKTLNTEEIKALFKKQLPLFKGKNKVHDKANHLEISNNLKKEYFKSYSLKVVPDSGELNFWLREFLLRFKTESFISIKLEYRDANQDRKKAESKASILSELKKSKRASTQSIIKDNKALSETLIEKPYSFNLSINFCIKTNCIETLKELDSKLSQPIKNCEWSPEERNQLEAFQANLPCSRLSKSHYIHYTDLNFAVANFCFFATNFPKDTKYLIGKSLSDDSQINLNEANAKLHKTRSINFIGDSGSGKSLLAKSMIIKRLKEPELDFFIIDNTKEGWSDFCLSLGGEMVDLNDSNSRQAYFNPFYEKVEPQELSSKIQNLVNFFSALTDQEKLSLEDKDFLGKSLRAFILNRSQAKLSDLYLFWATWEQRELAFKWQNLIAPYCHITHGAYAYLLDGKPREYKNKLELFQFSTINQEKSFCDICFYLINQELEKRASQENKKITLVIDEAWRLMQSSKARQFLSYYARAGRAIECALWTISQKPSDLAKEIYSSASINISFHLKEKTDQEKLKSLVGFEEHELKLFQNTLLKARGNCIIKTNYGTDLVKVEVSEKERLICSSEKDLLTLRKKAVLC